MQKQLKWKLGRVVHFSDDTSESVRFAKEAIEHRAKLREEEKIKRIKSIQCSNYNKMVRMADFD